MSETTAGMADGKMYAERDVEDDALMPFYMRHLDAMTREGLHRKSAIAAELAFRDMQRERMRKALEGLVSAVGDCGYDCRQRDVSNAVTQANAALAASPTPAPLPGGTAANKPIGVMDVVAFHAKAQRDMAAAATPPADRAAIRAEVLEEAAKVADKFYESWGSYEARDLAAEIRALAARPGGTPADEAAKLRQAITDAGFAVMETSGKWSIHDVSEKGKADDEKSLAVASENVHLSLEVKRLRKALEQIASVPRPPACGWLNAIDSADVARAAIADAPAIAPAGAAGMTKEKVNAIYAKMDEDKEGIFGHPASPAPAAPAADRDAVLEEAARAVQNVTAVKVVRGPHGEGELSERLGTHVRDAAIAAIRALKGSAADSNTKD